jgi:hypothetical protein
MAKETDVAHGSKRRQTVSGQNRNLVAVGPIGDKRRRISEASSGELFPRSLDLVVHDLPRFREGLSRGGARHCFGQSQPVLIVYRHDEPALARQIEAMEIEGL